MKHNEPFEDDGRTDQRGALVVGYAARDCPAGAGIAGGGFTPPPNGS